MNIETIGLNVKQLLVEKMKDNGYGRDEAILTAQDYSYKVIDDMKQLLKIIEKK